MIHFWYNRFNWKMSKLNLIHFWYIIDSIKSISNAMLVFDTVLIHFWYIVSTIKTVSKMFWYTFDITKLYQICIKLGFELVLIRLWYKFNTLISARVFISVKNRYLWLPFQIYLNSVFQMTVIYTASISYC